MSHGSTESEDSKSGGKLFDAEQKPSIPDFPMSPVLKSEIEISSSRTADQFQDELLIKSWLSGKSKNTKRSYLRFATAYLAWIHPIDLNGATIHHVQGFLEARLGEKRATRALKVAAVKSLLTYAQRTGYLIANLGAFIPGVKSESKLTDRYLSEEEVVAIIACVRTAREEAVIRLLYSGGLRVGELISLNWADVQLRDEGEAQLKIKGKGDKERVVIISRMTTEALLKLKSEVTGSWEPVLRSDYGAKTRLTDRTVRDIVFRIAMRAGINKAVSPHWLRHAHASHALDRGAPIHLVQTTLGHASVATTGRYLHARPQESSGKYLVD